MSIELHTISMRGQGATRGDRLIVGNQTGVANGTAAAGATVSVAVAMAGLPANYTPVVNPGQGCGWFVSAKTSAGFTVNLVPFVSTATIAAGTFDVLVVG